jgi:hypothetical protein
MMIKFLRSESFLILLFCIAVVAYLIDAVNQSMAVENLIFVLPLSLTTLTLGAVIIYKNIRSNSFFPGDAAREARSAVSSDARLESDHGDVRNQHSRSLTLMGLFAAFVFCLTFGPFDVVSTFFTFAAIYSLGERRWIFLIVLPITVGLGITGLFSYLLPYPMTTLFFGG